MRLGAPVDAVADRSARAGDAEPGVRGWAGLAARLLLGVVLLVAGALKLADLPGSVESVVAYRLLPFAWAEAVGLVLPVLEVAVGALLLLGLFTRPGAVVAGLLMLAFVAGVVSAWARGLSNDCGCFGDGGPVAPGEASHLPVLLRDGALLVVAAGLAARRPPTPLSLDRRLSREGAR